jgi:hypothetical protein
LVIVVAAVAHAGITVSQPTDGTSVPLSMRVVASASPSSSSYRISAMQIVVNSVKLYSTSNSSLDTYVAVNSGSNRVQVKAWDTSGAYFEKLMYVTGASTIGTSTTTKVIYNIEHRSTGWFSCDGCAGKNLTGADATYWMRSGQPSPSMDGNSAEFFLGGSIPYANALWSQQLVTDGPTIRNMHYLTNDLYFYYTNANATQGLEFNLSQYIDGVGYIYGVQCNIRSGAGPHWDISVPRDYSKPLTLSNMKWQNTGVYCKPPTYTWNHVTLEFQRTSDNKVKFISITLNGAKSYINVAVPARIAPSDWKGLNTHYQMNGNYQQEDYHTWVDKWTVSY